MTIQRVKPATWGTGDKLEAAHINEFEDRVTSALDKRSGETDTLGSVVTCSGAGRIVSSYATGANTDTTYFVSGANALIDVPTLSADRAYTFSNTNAQAGDRLFVLNRSSFYLTLKNAAGTTLIVLGSELYNNGESGWAEVMFTGAAWVLARSALRPALLAQTFTSNGTWTCPRGVTLALVYGWGGGGSGGGGGAGIQAAAPGNFAIGGAGGGGSQRQAWTVQVGSGTSYAATIGPGGLAVGGGVDGNDGGDSSLGSVAIFHGAQGGSKGVSQVAPSNIAARGGGPTRLAPSAVRSSSITYANTSDLTQVAHAIYGGGGGAFVGGALVGVGSSFGLPGGSAGTPGTTLVGTNTYYGGGPGGGGGGGGGGPGGAGGNGGNGSGTLGQPGTNGGSAGANSGGGGGGGGAGGAGATGAGVAGNSGAGGSGCIIVVPLR